MTVNVELLDRTLAHIEAHKVCRFDGCDKPSRSLGWCVAHYKRYWRHGDPAGKNRPKLPWPDRFWSQVDKTGDCWLWTGAVDVEGYGHVTGPDGRRGRVHRLSFVIAGGEIPPDAVLRHTCDVRNCVNPTHLLPGTPAENVADCMERDRHRALAGDAAPWAKVTDDDVDEIRSLWAQGVPQKVLAARFGVAQPTNSGIVNRKSRIVADIKAGAS